MPVSGGASFSRTPTHDQLDELDALMQRMLQLPVDPFEAAEDPLPGNVGEQEMDQSKRSEAHEPRAPERQEDFGLRPRDFEDRSLNVEDPSPAPGPFETVESASSSAAPIPADIVTAETYPHATDRPATGGRARPGLAGHLRLLLLIDAVFEWATAPFGSTGAWLRSDSGRNILGILGVLAAVWSLIWLLWGSMSWTW
jgi:hypothetical protein